MRAPRFAIGQLVRLTTRYGMSAKTAASYRITRVLPEGGDAPQYRIRSEDELHERVASEDTLEEITSTSDSAKVGV